MLARVEIKLRISLISGLRGQSVGILIPKRFEVQDSHKDIY